MALEFKDRVSQHPNRRKLTTVMQDGGVMIVDVERAEGDIQDEGTPLNAINLNTLAPKDSPEFTGTPKKNGVNIATVEDTVAAAEKLVTNEPKVVTDVISGSRITATNDVEIIDSQPSVKTAEIKSIKGCSIKAIQKNGNFDGMAGWVLNNATATTSNGIATFTVTANSDCGIAADSSQQSLQSIAGHKYYISAWIKAKYARSVDFGFSNDPIQFTAVANQWVRLSVLVTPSISDDVLYLTHDCSAQYVIGDTFQIQDFRCIDLTESSQSLYNMTKEQLNVRLPNLPYFEGIRHTNITKLTSVGDNWADVDDFTENVNNAISNNRLLIDNIPIAGTVTITFDTEKISGATPQYITVGYGTETFNYIKDELFNQSAGKAKQSITIAITEEMIGCNLFIRYYSFTAPSTASYHISNIMLKHANNALTEYLPYKTDYVDIPQYTLRSLADGTADEITPTQYIQRLDINGNKLSEAIYTPITWDNKYSAWNYGMEKTVAGANGHGMALFTIKYPLDVVKQVETNTEILAEQEKQIAENKTQIDGLETDKLDKVTGTTASDQAYIKKIGGTQAMYNVVKTPTANAIPQYDENGKLKTNNPTAFNDCVRLADLNAMKLYHHNYEIGGAAGGGSTEFSYLIHISFYDRADGAMNNAQLNNYLNERGFLKSTGKSLSVTGIVIDESRNLASPAVAISYISASTFNIRYVSQYSNTLADVTATVSDIIVSNVYEVN